MADHIKLVHSSSDTRPSATTENAATPLKLLQGGLENDGKAFARAYHAAIIAQAERELIEARWLADHHLLPRGTHSPYSEQRGPAFDKLLHAVAEVALTPATDRLQLDMKKRAIGRVWLKAEGQLFDQFRERIALDEAALAKRSAKRGRS